MKIVHKGRTGRLGDVCSVYDFIGIRWNNEELAFYLLSPQYVKTTIRLSVLVIAIFCGFQ